MSEVVRRLIDDDDIQSILDSIIDLVHKKDPRTYMIAVSSEDGTVIDNVIWDGDEDEDAPRPNEGQTA